MNANDITPDINSPITTKEVEYSLRNHDKSLKDAIDKHEGVSSALTAEEFVDNAYNAIMKPRVHESAYPQFRNVDDILIAMANLQWNTRIECYGELPSETSPGEKIEMFAREKHPQWDVWGNEVESDIDINEYITHP